MDEWRDRGMSNWMNEIGETDEFIIRKSSSFQANLLVYRSSGMNYQINHPMDYSINY